ncbi:MAG: hypothetical protein BGO34_21580 [Bacteroidia bacterium 44-10]|nr:MAG: hypothetical protein BGO34_21580 [Bacteroidia bacterium 44-10]
MKQFVRNFKKQKTVGILNICGLCLGIMCSLLVGLWAINEFTFDNFHKNGDRTYRVVSNFIINDKPTQSGGTYRPLGEEALRVIPEIEQQCRVTLSFYDEVTINNKIYQHQNIILADSNFFSFFSFPLVDGHLNRSLLAPDEVVISQKVARQFFGDEKAIGEIIRLDNKEFRVTAVMQDMPVNSHLQADFVFPFFGYVERNSWGWSDVFMTYFILQDNPDIPKIETTLSEIINSNMRFMDFEFKLTLQTLKDIHFSIDFSNDDAIRTNRHTVMLYMITALIILLISCINFANMFVSTSFLRAKSIGVKKVQGSSRERLIWEFYGETACYVAIAIIGGILLAYLVFPSFSRILHSHISIDFTSIHFYLFLVILFLFTVFVAGSYPALYMTRFGIIETVFGRFKGKRISLLQKSLVVLQFTASISLLVIIFFFNKQIRFMLSADLGFNKENILVVYGRDNFGANFESLRDELMKEPSIANITMKNSLPSHWKQGWGVKTVERTKDIMMEICRVKENYFDFFEIPIIDGDNPFNLAAADSLQVCVINQTAAKALGLDNPLGATVILNNRDHVTVVGVVRDAWTGSFHSLISPQVYFKLTDDRDRPLFFKISGNPQKAIQTIQRKWEEVVPDVPFEYLFLDNSYAQLYESETNASKVLSMAMAISFLITIIGLFAMAYYSTQRRVKEIAIRKINGANPKDLQILLNKDFMTWVGISFVIACPISFFFVHKWLDDFMQKTTISWWIFLLAGISASVVALITVSFQIWKAARANPVDSLKGE